MRALLLPLFAFGLGAPSTPYSGPAADMPIVDPQSGRSDCPETPMSLARKQGENPRAQPLDQLPDAMVFAAVDRRVDDCPAPLVLGRQPLAR